MTTATRDAVCSLAAQPARLAVFSTRLGWMTLAGRGDAVVALTFGHASRAAALERAAAWHLAVEGTPWQTDLVERLRAFAAGCPDDFIDVPIDVGRCTPFSAEVLRLCRRIGYGQTSTYGALAAAAGRPAASRAVGNCMARNRIPIVVPCHRVLPACGRLGGFSAPGGVELKRRLLAMEAAAVAEHPCGRS